jgi:hypothetical protein
MRRGLLVLVAVAALWACGGQTFTGSIGDGGSSSSSGGSGSSGGSSASSSGGQSSGSSGGSSGGGSGGSSSSSGGHAGEVPIYHRPNDAECLTVPPPGNCQTMGGPGMCKNDSSCTAGVNGRCVESGGGVLFCSCTYDTCAQDADCPAGKTCACHGATYTGGQGNTCVPGNCRVDGDCGPGGYCSPSYDPMSCGGLLGYYCHTAQDQCVNDSDCNGTGTGPQVCLYSTTTARWQCAQEVFCG